MPIFSKHVFLSTIKNVALLPAAIVASTCILVPVRAATILDNIELRTEAEMKATERPAVVHLKSCPKPEYPVNKLNGARPQGKAIVEFVINEEGAPVAARKLGQYITSDFISIEMNERRMHAPGLPQDRFTEEYVGALTIQNFSKCRFSPAIFEGKPIKGKVIISYEWDWDRIKRNIDETTLEPWARTPLQMYRNRFNDISPADREYLTGVKKSFLGKTVTYAGQPVDLERQKRELKAMQPAVDAWNAANDEQVGKILETLVLEGNSRAQYWSAIYFYRTGQNDPANLIEAARLANLAAISGNPDAIAFLSMLNMDKNYPVALAFLKIAVAADSGHAHFMLANEYASNDYKSQVFHGAEKLPQDFAKALSHYERAANLGYLPAQYNLGLSYLKGRGTEPDRRKAYFWLKVAADRGTQQAASALKLDAFFAMPDDQKVQQMLAEWNAKPQSAAYQEMVFLTTRKRK